MYYEDLGIFEIRRRVSTRDECRWPGAHAAVHLHNTACPTVTRLHAPRVSQLLLPSCSFPNMRTNSISWYKSSILDWFPKNYRNIIGIPEHHWYSRKEAGIPRTCFSSWERGSAVPKALPTVATNLMPSLLLWGTQEHIHVVRSNRVVRKRPARGHSRNGPLTWSHAHTHIGKQKRNRTKHTSIKSQHIWIQGRSGT